jgi:hypothetical protein
MLYRYQGLGSEAPAAAGPVNGIAALKADLRTTAAATVDAFGPSAEFDRADYLRFLEQAKSEPSALRNRDVSTGRVRNFVLGTIADVSSSVARSVQISRLPVSTEAERTENHRLQAELIGPARIMLDAAVSALRGIEPRSSATAGLGAPWVPVALAAIAAAAWATIGVTAVVMIALCYESRQRLAHARAAADAYCARHRCSAEEYARIVRTLQLGPLDRLAGAAQDMGLIAAVAGAIGGGALLLVGIGWFLFGTRAGRKTREGMRQTRRQQEEEDE